MAYAISIELGGSHAVVGLIQDRTILSLEEFPVSTGSALLDLLPHLAACAHRLMATNNLEANDLIGVGMSIAALVDWKHNRVVSTNGKYPDASSIDLCQWSRMALGLPLRLENDARMALLGECYAGGAQDVESVVMVTIGTGIGCAAVIEGRLLRTSQPQGGCLGGHISVNMNGRNCTCGAVGCMEAEASTWALPLILAEWPGIENSILANNLNGGFEALFRAASSGDLVAEAVRQHCVRVWAVGVVGMIHTYGPELIVFGGGAMNGSTYILPELSNYVEQHAWTPTGPVPMQISKLGSQAALFGAIPILENQ